MLQMFFGASKMNPYNGDIISHFQKDVGLDRDEITQTGVLLKKQIG